jgi:Domain of unknown function (DUF4145)
VAERPKAKLLRTKLDLGRCPHCGVDTPSLNWFNESVAADFRGVQKFWRIYICARCANFVIARAVSWDQDVSEIYPQDETELSDDIPERARTFLKQAIESKSAPSGAVMLAASAVDAMLKEKGLKDGSLYARINAAATQHLITVEMAEWAHDVRVDANDQRHADEESRLPEAEDAKRVIEFVQALAQFMFVLPARVRRGIEGTKSASQGS